MNHWELFKAIAKLGSLIGGMICQAAAWLFLIRGEHSRAAAWFGAAACAFLAASCATPRALPPPHRPSCFEGAPARPFGPYTNRLRVFPKDCQQ